MSEKLHSDRKTHPCLKYYCHAPEEFEQFVRQAHRYLMSDDSMVCGYLYQQQVIKNRELKEQICQLTKNK